MRKNDTFQLVLTALLGTIILAMSLIPQIGFITIIPGIVTVTIVHIPVLIGVFLLKRSYAITLGGIFGIGSLLAALIYATNPFDQAFIYPWISILPRLLFAFVAYILIDVFKKIGQLKYGKEILFVTVTLFTSVGLYFGMRAFATAINSFDFLSIIDYIIIPIVLILAGVFYYITKKYDSFAYIPSTLIIATFTHTILVLGTVSLLSPSAFVAYFGDSQAVISIVLMIALSNGLVEAILAAVIGTPVVIAIKKKIESSED